MKGNAMEPNRQFTSPEGVIVKIWWKEKESDTVNVPALLVSLAELSRNYEVLGIKPPLLKGLTLEFWHTENPACPRSTPQDRKIDTVAGLAFGWLDKVQINYKFNDDNTISHEIGHIAARRIGFDHGSFRVDWNRIRGVECTDSTPAGELIAEDLRILFGCGTAKGFRRTDKYNYRNAIDVPGLREFYICNANLTSDLIWYPQGVRWVLSEGKCEGYWTKSLFGWFGVHMKADHKGLYEWDIFGFKWKQVKKWG